MKGLRIWLTAGIASATLMLLSVSPASALQFWITRAGDATPITELLVAPGEVFTISVWAQHSPEAVKGLEVVLGYTTATTMGTGATPAAAKVLPEPPPPSTASVTNEFADLGPSAKSWGGFRGTGTRPYGLRWVVLSALGSTDLSAGKKLFDITFKNESLVPGDSPYPLVLHDNRAGSSWTLLATLANGQTIRPGGSYTLNLIPVPEPGGLMALATGVVGLAGMALRRRRA
ncbi:MAG: PEP-CTERM sorting domain-containing protein [Armatimonadota bacterium]